jgi:hypothetical protein
MQERFFRAKRRCFRSRELFFSAKQAPLPARPSFGRVAHGRFGPMSVVARHGGPRLGDPKAVYGHETRAVRLVFCALPL